MFRRPPNAATPTWRPARRRLPSQSKKAKDTTMNATAQRPREGARRATRRTGPATRARQLDPLKRSAPTDAAAAICEILTSPPQWAAGVTTIRLLMSISGVGQKRAHWLATVAGVDAARPLRRLNSGERDTLAAELARYAADRQAAAAARGATWRPRPRPAPKSPGSYLAGLTAANTVRDTHKKAVAAIAAAGSETQGTTLAVALINDRRDPQLGSIKVGRVINAIPQIGPVRAEWILDAAGVEAATLLRELTSHVAAALTATLRGSAPAGHGSPAPAEAAPRPSVVPLEPPAADDPTAGRLLWRYADADGARHVLISHAGPDGVAIADYSPLGSTHVAPVDGATPPTMRLICEARAHAAKASAQPATRAEQNVATQRLLREYAEKTGGPACVIATGAPDGILVIAYDCSSGRVIETLPSKIAAAEVDGIAADYVNVQCRAAA
jgi:ribosomal protein S13